MSFLKKSACLPIVTGIVISALFTSGTLALAKVRPLPPVKAKPIEASSIKGVIGEASLTLQHAIPIPDNGAPIQFQDGKTADTIEFYNSPRCYLHFRKGASEVQNTKELTPGHVLHVAKIDNIYANGSVHVTFYFDRDPSISDLACITNYNHTLTVAELKSTLGNSFQIALTKSVENDALFNTVPSKDVKVLSEDTFSNSNPTYSARIILTDS